MNFYNEAARHAYEQRRRLSSQEYKKEQSARELAAVRKRVPEQLPYKYAVINYNEKWQERSRYQSDSLRQLWANAGTGLDTVRYMIDTGREKKTFNGWMKIVPVEEGKQNGS